MRQHFLFNTGEKDNTGGKQPEAEIAWTGKVSEDQIAKWKKEYPLGIFYVATEEGHIAYFKNPTRNDVNCALRKTAQPLDRLEELFDLTFIGGSDEIKKNDTMLMGVCNKLQTKMDGSMAVLVNL